MVRVKAYSGASKAAWDDFVRSAKNGHFLFYRDYMDYHADRFPDASLMFYGRGDRLMGLLRAALRDGIFSSHRGLPLGGVVSGNSIKPELMLEVSAAMHAAPRGRGVRETLYKPVPHIYHHAPAEE